MLKTSSNRLIDESKKVPLMYKKNRKIVGFIWEEIAFCRYVKHPMCKCGKLQVAVQESKARCNIKKNVQLLLQSIL